MGPAVLQLPRLAAAGVRHGFSTSLLGGMQRDGDTLLTEPRRRLAEALGLEPELAFLGAVHGAAVAVVRHPGLAESVDALVTDRPGLALFATFADCYPIIVFDPNRLALALAHAGWRGTRAGVAAAAVSRMTAEFGSRPGDLVAGIGPGICGSCYQVGTEVAAEFDPAHVAVDEEGHHRVDLAAANRDALIGAGLSPSSIEVSGVCTFEDRRLASHRRDADGERFGCLAAIA